jgi:arsenate reductase
MIQFSSLILKINKKMIKIYHNPRCGKSREGLAILEQSQQRFEVIKYLETPMGKSELEKLILQLGIKPIELIRIKESIWIEQYKGRNMTDSEIIEAVVKHPILMERPIVIHNDKAVIGRPPEKIKEIV